MVTCERPGLVEGRRGMEAKNRARPTCTHGRGVVAEGLQQPRGEEGEEEPLGRVAATRREVSWGRCRTRRVALAPPAGHSRADPVAVEEGVERPMVQVGMADSRRPASSRSSGRWIERLTEETIEPKEL